MTRIICSQFAPRLADLPANIDLSVQQIRQAAADDADIIVLPELATSGYMFTDREEARATAVTTDHPLFAEWAQAAGRATVVAGFCELGDDGQLYTSAAVLDRSGLRAVYRKTHLWDREKLIFTPGNEPPPVLSTPRGRIGVLVCYDLEFPEMTRRLALHGADLIAAPVNWPLLPRPSGEHPPELIIAMAAARVNRVFIACCDRTGEERSQRWTEGTAIIDQNGWLLTRSNEHSVATADVDLAAARDKRLTPLADVFTDRRPELYAPRWPSPPS